MDSARTISQLKSTFLLGQVRIFSENLEPPENWRHHAAEAEEELAEKVIEDVLHKGAFVSHSDFPNSTDKHVCFIYMY